MKEEKYWVLLAKKLNHEATHEELLELDSLLRQNGEWAAQAEQFQEIWNAKPEYLFKIPVQKMLTSCISAG